jgi:CxxC motif-containing protein (DUF1111 family)
LQKTFPLLLIPLVVGTAPLRGLPVDIAPATEVTWPSETGSTYQAQWATTVDGPWTDLAPRQVGTGGTLTVSDDGNAGRTYRVRRTTPGIASVGNALANGGFETGSATTPTLWTTSGTIHSRVNTDAHSGAFSQRALIVNASSVPGSGLLVSPTAESIEPGRTYTAAFWSRLRQTSSSFVHSYRVTWQNAAGTTLGSTGYVRFSSGAEWTETRSDALTAPAGAAAAQVGFYFATGSVTGAVGEILLDDVRLEFAQAGTPASETDQTFSRRSVAKVTWPTQSGATYVPEFTTDLAGGQWTPLPAEVGDGQTRSIHIPFSGGQIFCRISHQPLTPPSNVRVTSAGVAGTLAVTWDAAVGDGLTGYRIVYGTGPDALTQSVEVGPVGSATLTGLTPGTTYFVAVIALGAGGVTSVPTIPLAAEAETDAPWTALFDSTTPQEPDVVVETAAALVTHLADRARDRHAREDIVNGVIFRKYDHYLTWYWEQRVANIEIIDRVAKGGTAITFNYTTQAALNPAEFRAFFRVDSPLSGYHTNAQATLVSSGPSTRYPGETDYNYTITLATKQPEGRPLRLGDRMEIEISQFLLGSTLRNGRENYYGTAFLYVVGEGVVPWYARVREETTDPAARESASFDSYPLPESAWLGGRTTLPYQYSNEPSHRFKQMAGNISPASGYPFLHGRRLHHTDFLTGEHTEPGNPPLAVQAGKVGPRYVAQSCVSCHVNNGRSLPPAIGAPLRQSVVRVAADTQGTPHPILGEELQPLATSGPPEAGVTLAGYTETPGTYGDGTPFSLRKPSYTFTGVTPTHFSVRVAPPLVGLGLLEAVDESTLAALADPTDADGDGISGRLAVVDDPENPGVRRVGRFTWKASQAMVSHQIAYALNRDMGITTEIFPVLDGETQPRPPEISASELDEMTRYVRVLGVGAKRHLSDPVVVRGEQLFQSLSCVRCHTPELPTGPNHPLAELRGQTIRPYTDLLLHEMGPGLADSFRENGTSGSEWRTAPLWNIGLTAGVSGGEAYLHDGRARTLAEAILWHGGEAEAAKEAFRTLPAADRAAVLAFLQSL